MIHVCDATVMDMVDSGLWKFNVGKTLLGILSHLAEVSSDIFMNIYTPNY